MGNWKGYREIHLEGDWLLIYRVKHSELLLVLTRTGSHDDLF
ncbi:type II toxin-antitoxin system RelE/ParE family toxin [Schaalia turicensis]|nr:type II toxin-antitoxin system mRNA interferase toxin, RelE/StbE family [Schaalia turicensis]